MVSIDTCHRLPTASPSPLLETISSKRRTKFWMHTFEQQAETSTTVSRFLSTPKKTFLLQWHFHGIILMQSSSETSPQEIVQQRSESRVLNESFDKNFYMAGANLAPDFRNCQFHGCNFHFNSPN